MTKGTTPTKAWRCWAHSTSPLHHQHTWEKLTFLNITSAVIVPITSLSVLPLALLSTGLVCTGDNFSTLHIRVRGKRRGREREKERETKREGKSEHSLPAAVDQCLAGLTNTLQNEVGFSKHSPCSAEESSAITGNTTEPTDHERFSSANNHLRPMNHISDFIAEGGEPGQEPVYAHKVSVKWVG